MGRFLLYDSGHVERIRTVELIRDLDYVRCQWWRVQSDDQVAQLNAPPQCCTCDMAGIESAPWAVVDVPFDFGTTEPAARSSYCEDCFSVLLTDGDETGSGND